MIKSSFSYTIFIVFAPNELECTHCCVYNRYSEAFSSALKEFSDCGFEIFRSELVFRAISDKDVSTYDK